MLSLLKVNLLVEIPIDRKLEVTVYVLTCRKLCFPILLGAAVGGGRGVASKKRYILTITTFANSLRRQTTSYSMTNSILSSHFS